MGADLTKGRFVYDSFCIFCRPKLLSKLLYCTPFHIAHIIFFLYFTQKFKIAAMNGEKFLAQSGRCSCIWCTFLGGHFSIHEKCPPRKVHS